MAKLTKTQITGLQNALHALERGIEFILDSRISVCRKSVLTSTVLDFHRDPPPASLLSRNEFNGGLYALTEIDKEIGSELCLLYDAKRRLRAFIDTYSED